MQQWVGYAILIVLAIFLLFGAQIARGLQHIKEDVAFALHPNAQMAYNFGVLHLDPQQPSNYDISRAEYFFRKAASLNDSLLYVHHELARIYFLQGDFGDAMTQIDLQIAEHGTTTPNSYYVRGLIEGYMGAYDDAAADYAEFLRFDPHNWAGVNDYAWVLMKAGRYDAAANVTADTLHYFPTNPWLLNSNAIALYETGHLRGALSAAQKALAAVQTVTTNDWLHAYPGNDPAIAAQGIASLKKATADNMHMIQAALASSTIQ